MNTWDERHPYWTVLIFSAIIARVLAWVPEGARYTMLSGAAVAFFGGLTRALSKRRQRR